MINMTTRVASFAFLNMNVSVRKINKEKKAGRQHGWNQSMVFPA